MMKFTLGIVLGAVGTYMVMAYPAQTMATMRRSEDAARGEAVAALHTGEKAASEQLKQLSKQIAP
jgi:hypothetical protein